VKKLKFLVSLTTDENDYQLEQANAANEAARSFGVDVQVVFAENDAITQSQQLLKVIQSPKAVHPDAIIFEPVGGTALPQVARAAAAAGIGWAVLNREVDYIEELRKSSKAPIFAMTSDHTEIGRIQGRQLAALLPNGGQVLYIQGPSGSSAALQRTEGMYETKPPHVHLRTLKGQWTETSSYQAVTSWLRLCTSHDAPIDVVAGQDDSMALGAKKAFQEHTRNAERERWLSLPFIGIDGLPATGQSWVRNGQLTATVVVPPNAASAIEILKHALQTGIQPPERTTTSASSFPALEQLSKLPAQKARAHSV
jgi:ABC-type sugar transport system substrate-binding protein